MTSLRLVVAGSPAAAVPTLQALHASPHLIDAVITRPPSPQGRKRVLTPTPVEDAARAAGLPVLPARVLSHLEEELLSREVDLGVIVAYGGLVREPLLSWPRLGWINLHFSLLPHWRGAAPVQRALMAGEERAGLSVFQLTAGLDEGPLFAQETETVGRYDTAGTLLDRLSHRGASVVRTVVDSLAEGTAVAATQSGAPTFAPKLTREDGRIDWSEPVSVTASRIRGVTPEPGAFTTLRDGAVLKVLEAIVAHDAPGVPPHHCRAYGGRVLVGAGSGVLELLRVQPAGKSSMTAGEWMRGQRAADGLVFA